MDYCDIEWFALDTNRGHSVIFETASTYCTLETFVDYDGYSISSKEQVSLNFMAAVIWKPPKIKFLTFSLFPILFAMK